eukprot:1196020-Prorocentrum_minimum.AAC.14
MRRVPLSTGSELIISMMGGSPRGVPVTTASFHPSSKCTDDSPNMLCTGQPEREQMRGFRSSRMTQMVKRAPPRN